MATPPPVDEGTTARGVVVEEQPGDYIRLNTRPCQSQPNLLIVVKRYEKRDAGEVTCRSGFLGLRRTVYKLVEVTQRRRE